MNRAKLKLWAYDWANNQQIPQTSMDLFLDAAEEAIKIQPGVTSESLGDHSIGYNSATVSVLESTALAYLRPYRRLKFA